MVTERTVAVQVRNRAFASRGGPGPGRERAVQRWRLVRRIVVLGVTATALTIPSTGAGGVGGAEPPMWMGVTTVPRDDSEIEEIIDLESSVGQPFGIVRTFKQWGDPFPSDYESWALATGHRLMISLKPEYEKGAKVRWADIAAAAPGTPLHEDIARLARGVRDIGRPTYFIFHHEPEVKGHEVFGEAPQFIAAWRNVVTIFRSLGASNVKFLFTMTDHAFRVASTDPRAADLWYPGDDYVDAIGADVYNWFDCRVATGDWSSLDVLLGGHRRFGQRHPTKELWLPELGSIEDAAVPGRKAAWFDEARAMFQQPDWAQYRGVIYFNAEHDDRYAGCDWWLDSTEESLASFGSWMNDPFFGGDGGTPPRRIRKIVSTIGRGGTGYQPARREPARGEPAPGDPAPT